MTAIATDTLVLPVQHFTAWLLPDNSTGQWYVFCKTLLILLQSEYQEWQYNTYYLLPGHNVGKNSSPCREGHFHKVPDHKCKQTEQCTAALYLIYTDIKEFSCLTYHFDDIVGIYSNCFPSVSISCNKKELSTSCTSAQEFKRTGPCAVTDMHKNAW